MDIPSFKKEPLHLQVKKYLKAYILKEKISRLPSENELTLKFKVSRTTIRSALKALEQEGIIKSHQGKGTFVSSPEDIALTQTIGIVIKRNQEPFERELFEELEACLRKMGYKISVLILDLQYDSLAEEIEKFISQIDGLFLCSQISNRKDVYAVLKSFLHKTVLIGHASSKNYPCNCVYGNTFSGFEKIAEHLARANHKKIAYLGLVEDEKRMRGIAKGLAPFNLKLSPDLIVNTTGWRNFGYTVIESLLTANKQFTAVIAQNDLCALGVIDRLLQEGIKIPDEVSVTGYDNITEAEDYHIPLTTAGADKKEIVEKAVEILLDGMNSNKFGIKKDIQIEAEMIVRNSTACAK